MSLALAETIDLNESFFFQCNVKLEKGDYLASGNFCHLLKTFANSLDPDKDRHNVGPDLDPNFLTHS